VSSVGVGLAISTVSSSQMPRSKFIVRWLSSIGPHVHPGVTPRQTFHRKVVFMPSNSPLLVGCPPASTRVIWKPFDEHCVGSRQAPVVGVDVGVLVGV
jgi:hypothetical protein